MRVHEIKLTAKKKIKKIIGRGGKKGSHSGRGMKGQKSRSGGRSAARAAGLRHSIIRRIPKLRGFKSFRPKAQTVNVEMLDRKFVDGNIISPETLFEKGLVKDNFAKVKILGDGEITKKLEIKNCFVSASAKTKIEKAGGKISSEA